MEKYPVGLLILFILLLIFVSGCIFPISEEKTTEGYTIQMQGNVVVAKNSYTGNIDFSGVNATDIIQKAIDNLPDYDGVIRIDPGTYNVAGIRMNGLAQNKINLTIEGSGPTTVFRLPNITRKNILEADNANGILLRDLQLDGNWKNQDMTNSMKVRGEQPDKYEIFLNNILVTNSQNVTVVRVYSHDAVNNGILYYQGVSNSSIVDSLVENCQWHGIRFWMGGMGSEVSGCTVRNCNQSAIAIDTGVQDDMGITVTNCTTSDDGTGSESGIQTVGNSNITISDNLITNQRIAVLNSRDISVVNNIINIINKSTSGILIQGNNHTIFQNTIYRPYYDAIRIAGNNSSVLENRMVEGGPYSIAIHLIGTANSSYNIIDNNLIINWSNQYGIFEDPGADYNQIINNSFVNVTVPRLNISGPHTVEFHNL